MKKIVAASIISMAFLSCGNNSNSTGGNDDTVNGHIPASDTSYKDTRGVINANGNIPDTSQYGASPNTYKTPKDSMNYDSLNNIAPKK